MSLKKFTFVFLILGIFFAVLAIGLSFRPISVKTFYQTNISYGIITSGFLSGVCFFVSGMLVYKSHV